MINPSSKKGVWLQSIHIGVLQVTQVYIGRFSYTWPNIGDEIGR